MKYILTRLLAAIAGIAVALSTAHANPAYTSGDLLLGVRASADPGSTQDYVVNIGPASQYTQATESFVVPGLGAVATDLAIFSESGVVDWFNRADVFWAVVGTDLATDPANTLYATRPRVDVNTQTAPWTRRSFSSQSTTNSTFRAFISGFTLSDSNAASAKGTIQSTSANNSYASFTSGGTDFGFFSGIEGNFGSGTANSVLDLYRLTPTTQNPAGEGLLFVGTFKLNDSGALTFTPAPPTAPSFRLSSATYTVSEDAGTGSVRVIRSGLTTGTDTVQFDTSNGTALAGTDYTAKNAFSVQFAPGATQVDVTVDVTEIAGLQSSRAFNVALSNPSAGSLAAPGSAVVTINDSAPQNFGQIAFSAASYSFPPMNNQAAPNAIGVTLNRSNGSDGAVSVDLSIAAGGTLVNGTDFNTVASPVTVQFAAGETEKTFTIQLAALADAKLPGTINLSLGNPQGGVSLGTTSTTAITITAKDKVKPSFKLTSKPGKVTVPGYTVAGTAKDNAGVDRVEVRVNGSGVQLATLGPVVAGTRTLNLAGITLENGKNTIVVTAFDSSGNAAKSTTVKLTYANSRPAFAGNYHGLVTAAASPGNNNTGFVKLTVSAFGVFTGKVTIGAAVLPIQGIFDNAGTAHFNAKGDTTAAPIVLALSKKVGLVTTEFGNLSLAISTDKVSGALKDGAATTLAAIDADRAFFDGKTPATTLLPTYLENKGAYTVVLPARATQAGLNATQFPQGDGAGTLTLTSKGVATFKGALADGTAVTSSAPISKDLKWPFFAKLYKSGGVIAGPVTFDVLQADSDLKGLNVLWIRPADAKAKHYPGGWSGGILTDLLGAKFKKEATASVLPRLAAEDLANGNANLQFFDGKLTSSIAKTVNISPKNKVTNAPADKSFSLKLVNTSGFISGKFKHTDNTSPAFKGAIFQKGPDAGGYGFFLSTVPKAGPSGESGGVTLEAK